MFSDYANQQDNYLFNNFAEINFKCVFGININKLRIELKLEEKTKKEFYIRMESTISYNLQDNFNNYELYTYDEGFTHYDFVENLLRMIKSNIKTNIKTWLNVAKSLIVVKFK